MSGDTAAFYDELASYYHMIFENWECAIDRQSSALDSLLKERLGPAPLKVLDCACGIGTQTIAVARLGHTVVASDLSDAAVRRAERETASRSLKVKFHVADMRNLAVIPDSNFDLVLACDNSLPHLLTDEDLSLALKNIYARLKPGGLFLATIRDYDNLLQTRPSFQDPAFYSEDERRRFVHQVWDWRENEYVLHLYITWQTDSSWTTKHFVTRYRALKRKELRDSLQASQFSRIEWLMPESTGFYQPIVIARKEAEAP